MRIKRGETFFLECAVANDDGSPVNITGWAIASEVRDGRGGLIATLTVDIHTPEAGLYSLLGVDTAAWPVGVAYTDIAYTDAGGRALSTETQSVGIEREVTQR
jgi:hypothetical protein